MQRHPFKQQILHLDFQRIDENVAIRFNVPLHFMNQDKSPAGKTAAPSRKSPKVAEPETAALSGRSPSAQGRVHGPSHEEVPAQPPPDHH